MMGITGNASISVSHVIGIVLVLYIADKWLDKKVKSFIDYAMNRPVHTVENFQPFESTIRTFDGRMLPDSPHLMEAIPSLTTPHGDMLAPLQDSPAASAASYMMGSTPMHLQQQQQNQNQKQQQQHMTASPKSFVSIADPAAIPLQYRQDGVKNKTMSWRDNLSSASAPTMPFDASPHTSLIDLDKGFQARMQQDGSQEFDQLMLNLDSDVPVGQRLQTNARTFAR